MLSAEQIETNYNSYIEKVKTLFKGERQEALLRMYDDLEDRLVMMPASGTEHFHNCFAGGYIDHVLRVMACAENIYHLWSESGADMSGYTLEELLFAAMHHDLGKAGFPGEGNEVYKPNPSEWHRRNQGKLYTHNPEIPFTMVPDLSIWMLQHYGVKMSWNEFQGIKTHDGLYDDSNKPYFISRSKDSAMHTNLPIVLHHADHMAARIEFERWKNNEKPAPMHKAPRDKKEQVKRMQTIASNIRPSNNADQLFKDLFGNT